ncbi:TetR/AcrR family transcriptional regulator [Aminipila terrae]|uniref:TetR family transcriptional regulator n=1 Tax=Aminipila terrae TaxID=2697030 RepID=A0A6P1MR10_9FIRM|nr:TetR/AcrR family transcriptional regulator [Aminipila terrae]QHI73435.1 TetR family transcriptional regulator [Aminipila terrae]
MEELRNHKIFTMEDIKRNTLITVAISKFAKNGYKKTTTDEIILEADISKGLLFHYFGTKKDLYVFLFKYSINTVMQEYYTQIDLQERDILKRLRNSFLLKFQLTNKYPAIFDFIASAFFERDPVVVHEISEYTKLLYFDVQNEILKNIDLSLFKKNVNTEKALNIILFTLRGYSDSQTSPNKRIEDYNKEISRYSKEIDVYISMLRTAFYKEDR